MAWFGFGLVLVGLGSTVGSRFNEIHFCKKKFRYIENFVKSRIDFFNGEKFLLVKLLLIAMTINYKSPSLNNKVSRYFNTLNYKLK